MDMLSGYGIKKGTYFMNQITENALAKIVAESPNTYNLTPENIKTVQVLNWDKLQKICWLNKAMAEHGEVWCHLEGCNRENTRYNDFNEAWFGFFKNGKVDFHITAYEGMCKYNLKEFYNIAEMNHEADAMVQANTIRFMNSLIDAGIVSVPTGVMN